MGVTPNVQKVQIYRTPGGYKVASQQKISQTSHFSVVMFQTLIQAVTYELSQ